MLLGLVSVVGMPYVVLMPIFAARILHRGGQEFAALIGSHDLGAVRLGILMGATGVGALLGALTLALRSGVKGLNRWVAMCSAGFGVSLVLFALSRWFWLSVLLLLPVGYFMMLQMASSNTLIQMMVPDKLRGRVMAVYSMMFMGLAPFGALLAGALSDLLDRSVEPLADALLNLLVRLGAPLTVQDYLVISGWASYYLGAPLTVAIGGLISIAGAIWFSMHLPKIRPEARRLIMAQQMAAGEPAEEITAEIGRE
jgi:MFS family permease